MIWRLWLLLALCAVTARGTTVRPPSFDELVEGSELIFRGEVLAVKTIVSRTGARPHPATTVVFRVENVIKGAAEETITLEFLGGEIAGKRLALLGAPEFSIGEHAVYFVENRRGRICPLTRLRHGRYPIVTNFADHVTRVVRDDGTALETAESVSRPLNDHRSRSAVDSLHLDQFERQVSIRNRELQQNRKVSR